MKKVIRGNTVGTTQAGIRDKLNRIVLDDDGKGADPTYPDGISAYDDIYTGEAVYTEHKGSDGKWRPILYPATGAALPGSSDQAAKERHFNQLKSKRIVIAGNDGKVLAAAPDGTVYEGESGDSDTFINTQNSVIPRHYADVRYVKNSNVTSTATANMLPVRDDDGVFSVGDATEAKHVLNMATANRKYAAKQTPAQAESVYTVKRSGSEDAGFTWAESSRPISTNLISGTISVPLRNSAGRFEVGDIGGASKGTTNYQALNARSLVKHLNLVMDKDYKLSLVFDQLEKTGLPDDTEYVGGDALIGQIDLPLETMVMDAEYDSEAGLLRLTLNSEDEDGGKKVVEVPIADVITLDSLKLESTKTDNTYTIQLKNGSTPLGEPIEIVDEAGTDFDMDRLAIEGSLSGTELTLKLLYKDLLGDTEDVLIYSTSIDLSALASGGGTVPDGVYVKRITNITDGQIVYMENKGNPTYKYISANPINQDSIVVRKGNQIRTYPATADDEAVPLGQMKEYVAQTDVYTLCADSWLSGTELNLELYYQNPDDAADATTISSTSVDLSELALGGGGGGGDIDLDSLRKNAALIPMQKLYVDAFSEEYAPLLPFGGSFRENNFSRTAIVGEQFLGLGRFNDGIDFLYVGKVNGTRTEEDGYTYVGFSCIHIMPFEGTPEAWNAGYAQRATRDGNGNNIVDTYAKKAQLGLASSTAGGKQTISLKHGEEALGSAIIDLPEDVTVSDNASANGKVAFKLGTGGAGKEFSYTVNNVQNATNAEYAIKSDKSKVHIDSTYAYKNIVRPYDISASDTLLEGQLYIYYKA